MEQQKMKLHYKDIIVVETFEEAEEFRYEDTDEPVEVGTPVAYESFKRGAVFNGHPNRPVEDQIVMTCFDGIYIQGGD